MRKQELGAANRVKEAESLVRSGKNFVGYVLAFGKADWRSGWLSLVRVFVTAMLEPWSWSPRDAHALHCYSVSSLPSFVSQAAML